MILALFVGDSKNWEISSAPTVGEHSAYTKEGIKNECSAAQELGDPA